MAIIFIIIMQDFFDSFLNIAIGGEMRRIDNIVLIETLLHFQIEYSI